MTNTSRKRRKINVRKRYKVPGITRCGWGGFQEQSTRAVLRSVFWKEYDAAYER